MTLFNILLSQATSLGEVFDELFEVGVPGELEELGVCEGVGLGVGEAGWLASEED